MPWGSTSTRTAESPALHHVAITAARRIQTGSPRSYKQGGFARMSAIKRIARFGVLAASGRARPDRRKRRGIHQHPHRRHRRRLLSARRGDFENLRRKDPRRQAVGAIDQGLGRKPQSAAGGQRRDRLHARRFARRRMERQRRSRLQGQARQAAHGRRDLSELHPDRRAQGFPHQHARRSQGQASVGRRPEVGHRTQCTCDLWPEPACRTRISARCNICRSTSRSN